MRSTSRVNRTRRKVLRQPNRGEKTDGWSLPTLPPAALDTSGTPVSACAFSGTTCVGERLCAVSGVWGNEASVRFRGNKGWEMLQPQTDGVTTCIQTAQAARRWRLMVKTFLDFEWLPQIYGLLSYFSKFCSCSFFFLSRNDWTGTITGCGEQDLRRMVKDRVSKTTYSACLWWQQSVFNGCCALQRLISVKYGPR